MKLILRIVLSGLALGAAAVAFACNGDDSSSGSSQSQVPSVDCGGTPCTTGKVCYLQPENACDGTWYCWADTQWHCGPQDGGGPGGPPPDAGSLPSSPDASPDAAPEAAVVSDASGG